MEKSAHFLIIQYFKIPLKFLAGILNKPFPMFNKCSKQRMYTEKKEVNDTYYLIFKENLTPTNSTIKFNWMKKQNKKPEFEVKRKRKKKKTLRKSGVVFQPSLFEAYRIPLQQSNRKQLLRCVRNKMSSIFFIIILFFSFFLYRNFFASF